MSGEKKLLGNLHKKVNSSLIESCIKNLVEFPCNMAKWNWDSQYRLNQFDGIKIYFFGEFQRE
jgi:hypothetical protein